MATKLPMRFRILHHFCQVKSASCHQLMDALRQEYGTEGQFNSTIFNEHLMSMRAGGLIEDKDASFDGEGNLIQEFAVTEFGRSRMKYLPKSWKP
jgi:hypothetical protein